MALSKHLQTAADLTETGEFTAIFGSAIKGKWFEYLLLNDGPLLFTVALILNVIKFGLLSYRYYKSRNKNINETESLIWTGVKSALIVVAIAGFLTAVTTFALITPILFVGAMGLDTLRNAGLAIWNAVKLIELNYAHSIRKAFSNIFRICINAFRSKPIQPSESVKSELEQLLDEQKAEKLREQYWAEFKSYGLFSVVGAIVTTGAAFVFLFPHIGLGAVAATPVIIGGLKTTAAGIMGFSAAVAMVAPIVIPYIIKGFKSAASGIKNFFEKFFTKSKNSAADNIIELEPNRNVQSSNPILEKLKELGRRDQLTTDNSEYNLLVNHKLKFNAYTKNSESRGIIFKSIPEYKVEDQTVNEAKEIAQKHKESYKQPALTFLYDLVTKKIQELGKQKDEGINNPEIFFAKTLRKVRHKKQDALQMVLSYLDGFEVHSRDKNGAIVNRIMTVKGLLEYIDDAYPEVDASFWKEQSDTRDVLNAVKDFGEKFPTQDELKSAAIQQNKPLPSIPDRNK